MNFTKTFVISDHHFGHANILKFLCKDGKTRIRPEFDHVDDMNHYMIQQHNSVVTDDSKVYFLGDVAFNEKVFHEIMPQLKGNKSLILGNHDHFKMNVYLKYFKNIYSARYIKYNDSLGFMLCHYPVHPECNTPKNPLCIHGHIHEKIIEVSEPYLMESIFGPCIATDKEQDKRYINVSVEQIDYTPISLESIAKRYGYSSS